MKIVINRKFGGFGLSDQAYEQLIAWGVPAMKYERDVPGEVIYDRELTPQGADSMNDLYYEYKGSMGRYWDVWTSENRTHPMLLRVVEELGEAANSRYANLKIVEIPDGIEWTIDDYDGMESIEEVHRSWA